jgi:eukaryotic-like serine/threonine-protein kinase
MASCPKCNKSYSDTQTTCPDDGSVLVPEAYVAQDRELQRGDTVGEYVIEGKIGSGTFGEVYRAVQPLIGKQVAIKILSRRYSADPHVVSRFIAEARAVNQIRHKHIIDIFSFGQLPDRRHYHIMELLNGTTLDRHLKDRGRLSVREALAILQGLARALDAAHAAGIAHRDLKPANVFLAWEDDHRPFPKLLDFGIAKLLSDDVPRHHQTATGAAVGTPDYMSPEQCQGPHVDHRTDVYAFGVMTYQLLTGRLPFVGTNVVEVLVKQMTAIPEPPSIVTPDLPKTLDAPILWALEKKKEDRPPNLATVMRALEQAAIEAGIELPAASHTTDPSLTPAPGKGPQVVTIPPAVIERVEKARTSSSSSGERPAAAFSESVISDTLPSTARGGSEANTVHAGRPAAPGRRVTMLVAALGVLAAIPAAVLITKLQSRGDRVTHAPVVKTTTAAPVLAQAGDAPIVAAATATVAAAAPPATDEDDEKVSLRVNSDPANVEIYAPGGVLLGKSPCTVKLIRGKEPIKLEFRSPGYVPLTKEFLPQADGEIEIALKKKPTIKPIKKKPKSDDIEDAFQ